MMVRLSIWALGLSRHLRALVGVTCAQLGLLLIAGPLLFWSQGVPVSLPRIVGLGVALVALFTGVRLLRRMSHRGSDAS